MVEKSAKRPCGGGEVEVCFRCGSENIGYSHEQGFDYGIAPTVIFCRDCGWRGISLVFDSRAEKDRYFREKKEC